LAEVAEMQNNILPYPIMARAYHIIFPIIDGNGVVISGATGLDSEYSKNGDSFTDCTNEATEIATNYPPYKAKSFDIFFIVMPKGVPQEPPPVVVNITVEP